MSLRSTYDGETFALYDDDDICHAEAIVQVRDGEVYVKNLVSHTGLHGYRLMREIDRFVGSRPCRITVDVGENMERLMRLYQRRFGVSPVAVILQR